MSRRNPSNADLLLMLPWQVSATLAAVAFITLRWVIPSIDFQNPFFAGFAQTSASLSWFALLFFGAVAGMSAMFAAQKRQLLDSQRDLESLRRLGWQQFEWMVGEAYRRQGYEIEESIAKGADGGIDVIARKHGQTTLIQCKQWKAQSIGAPTIREMFGLLAHHGAARVAVVTSGRFTREAVAFAQGKPIDLIDGPALLTLVQAVQAPAARHSPSPTATRQQASDAQAGRLPYQADLTPGGDMLCPTCGAPMVKRTAKRGQNAGNSFWGCSNYPKCRAMRAA